jgi:hypothetical protein
MYSCGPAIVDQVLRCSPEIVPAYLEMLEQNGFADPEHD